MKSSCSNDEENSKGYSNGTVQYCRLNTVDRGGVREWSGKGKSVLSLAVWREVL